MNAKTPLEVLQDHYVGKTLVHGDCVHIQYAGKKIVSVSTVDDGTLNFILTDGKKLENVTVLFDLPIGVA